MSQQLSNEEYAVLAIYYEWIVKGRWTSSGRKQRPVAIPESAVVAELRPCDFDVRRVANELHLQGLLAGSRPSALALGDFPLADGRVLSVRHVKDDDGQAIEAWINDRRVVTMGGPAGRDIPDCWASLTPDGIAAVKRVKKADTQFALMHLYKHAREFHERAQVFKSAVGENMPEDRLGWLRLAVRYGYPDSLGDDVDAEHLYAWIVEKAPGASGKTQVGGLYGRRRGKGGRRPLPVTEAKKREKLVRDWNRAKETGVRQKDFCKDRNTELRYLTICINWVAQRRRRNGER